MANCWKASDSVIGEGSYDPEQQSWDFPQRIPLNPDIQATDVFWQCLPPIHPHVPSVPAQSKTVRKRALTKRFPQVLPAVDQIHEIEQRSFPDERTSSTKAFAHCLIGIGKARDEDLRVNAKLPDILAVPSGKAGEVLRLVRPHIIKLGWTYHAGIHIEALDPSKPIEECYWAGIGGSIEQIKFAIEKNGTSNWLAGASTTLAVRQPNCTTIFRPVRRREQVPATVPKHYPSSYSPSRLASNPIFALPASKTGGFQHADVAFNPLYVKQFGIVDQGGFWSVWDMDGQEGKRTFKVERTKHGHIYDGTERKKKGRLYDGWGRILWAEDVNTLVVCSRCDFAVFNIRGQPTRLQIPDLFSSGKYGWILDVKQDIRRPNYLSVLTSKRVLWLKLTHGEDGVDLKVLIGFWHFRDDKNMKLEILSEESSCTLLLYSKKNFLIDTFRLTTNPSGHPGGMHSSFPCRQAETENTPPALRSKAQSISIIGAQYAGPAMENGDATGPGAKYFENDILFYQLFTLSAELELTSTICSTSFAPEEAPAASSKHAKYEAIVGPAVRQTKKTTRQSRFRQEAEEAFIDDNSDMSMDDGNASNARRSCSRYRHHKGLGQLQPYTLNYWPVFNVSFDSARGQAAEDEDSPSPKADIEGPCGRLLDLPRHIESWKGEETPLLKTFLEFMQSFSSTEDIDEVAATFSDLMIALPDKEEDEAEKILSISQLNGSDSSLLTGLNEGSPDLMAVYNYLLDIWVTCLPERTPGSVRLMKERLIRKVATELALSSVAVAMKMPPQEQKPEEPSESIGVALTRGTPFSSQLESIPESSQISSRTTTRDRGLLTPSATPSLVSESFSHTEGSEDPAIALLRTYADFRHQPPPGPNQSRILSQWTLGADPNKFSLQAYEQANAVPEDEDDDNFISQRERLRRKKKAEKRRKSFASTTESVSQPQPPSIQSSQPQPPVIQSTQPGRIWDSQPSVFGSQSAFPAHATSSQSIIPMTQVEQGPHGGRKSFKRPAKKRKQGF